MCGCMLMHATMNHQEHHPGNQPATVSGTTTLSASGSRPCAHCGFPLQQDFAFCPSCGINLWTKGRSELECVRVLWIAIR